MPLHQVFPVEALRTQVTLEPKVPRVDSYIMGLQILLGGEIMATFVTVKWFRRWEDGGVIPNGGLDGSLIFGLVSIGSLYTQCCKGHNSFWY